MLDEGTMKDHSKVMAPIIQELGVKRMAEIGVWKGHFARDILKHVDGIDEYWAIDPWKAFPKESGRMFRLANADWDSLYWYAMKMAQVFSQLKVARMDSAEAAKLFPKGYFDLVFIDGDHSYDAVLADIKAWTPLVQKGGLVTGHDLIRRVPGVYKALTEYFGNRVERLSATCWKVEI